MAEQPIGERQPEPSRLERRRRHICDLAFGAWWDHGGVQQEPWDHLVGAARALWAVGVQYEGVPLSDWLLRRAGEGDKEAVGALGRLGSAVLSDGRVLPLLVRLAGEGNKDAIGALAELQKYGVRLFSAVGPFSVVKLRTPFLWRVARVADLTQGRRPFPLSAPSDQDPAGPDLGKDALATAAAHLLERALQGDARAGEILRGQLPNG